MLLNLKRSALAGRLLQTLPMRGMVLAKISGKGLISIAMLVGILWACILGEHWIVARANREFSRAMIELRQLQLKRHAEPASIPVKAQRVRPSVG